MTKAEVLEELKSYGKESIKKVLLNHGVNEPFFGVKVEDLKKIQKKVKKDYKLSMELFDTGIYDAMYLAGLIADESKMSKADINGWAEKAHCRGISEYTVAWVASESAFAIELALQWIDSKKESVASSGWATLSSLVSIKQDSELNIPQLKKLLQRVVKEIDKAPNRVKYTMNGFIISAGCYVKELTEDALNASAQLGKVTVDMGGTACKVPSALDYINKLRDKGSIGKKRKTAKC